MRSARGRRSSRRFWRRRLRFSDARPSPHDAQADGAGQALAAVGQFDIAVGEQRRLAADGVFGAERWEGCRATNGVMPNWPPSNWPMSNGRPISILPASWLDTAEDLAVSVLPMPAIERVAVPSKRL